MSVLDNHLLVRVPSTLREEFRDVALSKRRSMSDLVREFMEQETAKHVRKTGT